MRVAGIRGELGEYIKTVPYPEWDEQLLRAACMSDKNLSVLKRLLVIGRFDVNTIYSVSITLVQEATRRNAPRILEVLCAAGANLATPDVFGATPLQIGLHLPTAQVLVANRVRISTMGWTWTTWGRGETTLAGWSPTMRSLLALEKGVDKCRAAVIALHRVKDAGKLWRWDRFLLVHISYAIWCSRADEGWQN